MAVGGLKPVVALYSTFLQRAMDQVIHDVALPNLPVVLAIDRSGAVGEDGETHQGFFDIPLLKALPNMTILAPSSAREMESCLRLALGRSGPTAIRYPKARIPCEEEFDAAPFEWGRGVYARRRSLAKVLVCALGPLSHGATKVSDELAEKGILVDVYSLRFANSLDEEYLRDLCSKYTEIVVIEDGAISGGVGESISAVLQRHAVEVRTRLIGFDSMPAPQASREELLKEAGLGEAELMKVLVKIAAPAGGTSVYDKAPLAARW
ncbi:MAG: dx [Spirochaetes bacterium]|nr:MAG: dx [Spirochaetota bacterium]